MTRKPFDDYENKPLFRSILVPISSEFYPPAVFQISAFLAKAFHSTVTSIYITEKRILDDFDRLSDAHLSFYEREEAQHNIRSKHLAQAEQIVFRDAKGFFKKREIPLQTKYLEGEFSEVIKNEIETNHYDLIIMGYGRACLIDYRLIDEISLPIWIESGADTDTLLAVCSNLAPNQKIQIFGQQLSELFEKKLHMIYVVDLEDPVIVDSTGKRSGKKTKEELIQKGQEFIDLMRQKGIQVNLVTGVFQKEVQKAARKINPRLILIGREQKQKGRLGLPIKNVKKRLAEYCDYSFLFIN
ncbi:hypothetical protein AYK25_07180 [Thermoplasmatales archaeon SM1-50]|nr:MAG: hypothetical protein AYK25_07180 [Thermoplasmatales archaeon SM1-50]